MMIWVFSIQIPTVILTTILKLILKESCFCFSQQTEDEKDLEYAFFGIYDGHGGKEASQYAKVRTQHSVFSHDLNTGLIRC